MSWSSLLGFGPSFTCCPRLLRLKLDNSCWPLLSDALHRTSTTPNVRMCWQRTNTDADDRHRISWQPLSAPMPYPPQPMADSDSIRSDLRRAPSETRTNDNMGFVAISRIRPLRRMRRGYTTADGMQPRAVVHVQHLWPGPVTPVTQDPYKSCIAEDAHDASHPPMDATRSGKFVTGCQFIGSTE
jgi:hypothetical protein